MQRSNQRRQIKAAKNQPTSSKSTNKTKKLTSKTTTKRTITSKKRSLKSNNNNSNQTTTISLITPKISQSQRLQSSSLFLTNPTKSHSRTFSSGLSTTDKDSLDPNIAYSMQGHNSEQGVKRWYRSIDVGQEENGQWAVLLNNRYARTNRNNRLLVPTKAYAMACAMEFENQTTYMIPHTMPLSEMAKVAIDRTPGERAELTENIMAIFNCDSATMRAEAERQPALAKAQAKVFNPMIHYIEDQLKIKIETCTSFWGSEQSDETNEKVQEHIDALNPYQFIVLDNITALGKSTIVGLNFLHENINIEQALRGSLMEEYYQMKVAGTKVGDTYGTWLLDAGARHRVASHRQAMVLLDYKMDESSNWRM